MRRWMFAALGLGLSACVTVPDDQRAAACAATDWAEYGLNDGKLGVPEADRADKFADCAALGQAANIAAYRAGRAQGLAQYCTAEQGYKVGYEGRRDPKVCEGELKLAFDQGFERGRQDQPVQVGVGFGLGFGQRFYPGYGTFYRGFGAVGAPVFHW